MDMKLTIDIDEEVARCLDVLCAEGETREELLRQFLGNIRSGVTRPGSWERPWLCQVVGHDWVANMEPDPEAAWRERPKSGNA